MAEGRRNAPEVCTFLRKSRVGTHCHRWNFCTRNAGYFRLADLQRAVPVRGSSPSFSLRGEIDSCIVWWLKMNVKATLRGRPFSCPATGASFYTGFQLPGFASWIRGFAPCSRPASGRGRIPSGIPPPVHPAAFGSYHGAASAAGSSGLVVEEPGRRAVLLTTAYYQR